MDQKKSSNSRLELQSILESILGSNQVHFQPPSNVRLSYPCIIYKLNGVDTTRADNRLYLKTKRYQITVVYRDPDSSIPDEVLMLPYAQYANSFTTDNLYHTIFNVYY